ncbi:hypothetical protein ALC53_09574 [Atta colombica]|uniref:Uncharacterized protein n=1 Tax=Atta colombica TaxID=520822 RepID=A0A195B6A4_9HYME|nr:hypothetical protein ALC53_09574 [Atta colombica]
MGELNCNEVLTSFGLVPNDALEGDGGTGLAGSQTLRFRDGPHAGPNAYVGHVLQQKVRRTVVLSNGAIRTRISGELRTPGGSISSRKPPRRGIDGSSAWRLLRHRRSPPPPAANTTRSGVTHGGQVGLPLMRRYLKIPSHLEYREDRLLHVGASVFAPFLAALTSTLHDQSCFEAVEWPLYRVGMGEKLESRETPRHATPRHATPRHATPRHARPGQARPKQRSGIRRGRCDDAIRASIRLLLFVPAASSGAERSGATPRRRGESIILN